MPLVALVGGPLAGVLTIGLFWLLFGVNDDQGIGDLRLFLLGAVSAGCGVALYGHWSGAGPASTFGWSLAAFILTFGLFVVALLIAVFSILNDGGLGPAH